MKNNKSNISLLVLYLIAVLCLNGCSFMGATYEDIPQRHVESIDAISSDEPLETVTSDTNRLDQTPNDDAEYNPVIEASDEYMSAASNVEEVSGKEPGDLIDYSVEQLEAAHTVNQNRYAYSQLDEFNRTVYNQMYLAIDEMSEDVRIASRNVDTLNRVFQCVMMDHPEFFWIDGFTYTEYTLGEEVIDVGFRGAYTIGRAIRDERQLAIDNYVNQCLAGAPSGDDYSFIKYIYEYIIAHTEYDVNAPDNQNICSVLINGRSVCQGYAKATQFLLNKRGLMCTFVTGTAKSGNSMQPHAWNLVLADGDYYYVDTTWGDASYNSEGAGGNNPSINYDYLCVPTAQIGRTHTFAAPVVLPSCASLKDNYYVREGLYFTDIDEVKLQAAFENAYAQNRSFVTLKTSDDYVYGQLQSFLLNEQNVFKYLKDTSGTVMYYKNDEMDTIRIQLTT